MKALAASALALCLLLAGSPAHAASTFDSGRVVLLGSGCCKTAQ